MSGEIPENGQREHDGPGRADYQGEDPARLPATQILQHRVIRRRDVLDAPAPGGRSRPHQHDPAFGKGDLQFPMAARAGERLHRRLEAEGTAAVRAGDFQGGPRRGCGVRGHGDQERRAGTD